MFLSVNMTEESKSNNVLESIHQDSESQSPLSQLTCARRWMMSNKNSDFTILLHHGKLVFKPGELIAWVLPSTNQIIVCSVGRFCVDGNYIDLIVNFVICGEFLSVETIDFKFFQCWFWQPFAPLLSKVRDDWVCLAEVLRVDNLAKIVVTFDYESHPIAQVFFHKIIEIRLVLLNVLLSVVRLIMGCHITSPEQYIRL